MYFTADAGSREAGQENQTQNECSGAGKNCGGSWSALEEGQSRREEDVVGGRLLISHHTRTPKSSQPLFVLEVPLPSDFLDAGCSQSGQNNMPTRPSVISRICSIGCFQSGIVLGYSPHDNSWKTALALWGVHPIITCPGRPINRGHASSTVTRFRISLRISMFNHASTRIRFNGRPAPMPPARD